MPKNSITFQHEEETGSFVNLFSMTNIMVLGVIVVGSYLTEKYNYLLFHSLSEIFSILIASSIFFFTWSTRRYMVKHYLLYIGIAYLFVGLLDLLHALSYKGMGIFPEMVESGLTIQLWISSRFLEAISLLFALMLPNRVNRSILFGGYTLITAGLLYWIFSLQNFPTMFVDGQGLTTTKVLSEYAICGILSLSLVVMFKRRQDFDAEIHKLITASILLTIMAEMAFTLYVDLYGITNMMGHILKVLSFYLIYLAVIHNGLNEPYRLLFRELKENENIIKQHQNHLNDLVVERTAELENSNAKLIKSNNKLQQIQKELIEAKNQAENASKVKSEFLAIMNHELRTPMNGVMGMAQLLLQETTSEEERRELQVIYNSGRALVNILDDIMELTRIEERKKAIRQRHFSLEQSLSVLYNMFLPSAKVKNLEFILEADLPQVKLWGDEESLIKILSNLLSNSFKFTDKGVVTLKVFEKELTEKNRTLRFEVIDTGIGIPEEQRSSIFMAFTQVDSSSTREFGGVGLGLALVQRLIQLLGGTTGLDSTLGEGSSFWVELPFDRNQETPLEESKETDDQSLEGNAPQKTYNILVVEDDLTNQTVIKRILKRYNFKITIVDNGKDALTLIKGFHFDAILMDCLMPIMDGYETSINIRSMEEKGELKGRVPIIALTAKVMKEDQIKCMESGMDGFLKKPLEITELESVLQDLIGASLSKKSLAERR